MALIPIVCPQCGHNMQMPESLQGKRVLCPSCKTSVEVVPAAEGAVALAPGEVPPPAPLTPEERKQRLSIQRHKTVGGEEQVCAGCGMTMPPDGVWCAKCGLNSQTGQYAQSMAKQQKNIGRWLAVGLFVVLLAGGAWLAVRLLNPPPPPAAPPPSAEQLAAARQVMVDTVRAELDEKCPMLAPDTEVELRLKTGRVLRGKVEELRNTYLRMTDEAGKPQEISFDQLDDETNARCTEASRAKYIEKLVDQRLSW